VGAGYKYRPVLTVTGCIDYEGIFRLNMQEEI